jgi:hypothetical protein
MKKNHNAHFHKYDHVQGLHLDLQHHPAKSLGGHQKLLTAKLRKQSRILGVVHALCSNLGIWVPRGTLSSPYIFDTHIFFPGVHQAKNHLRDKAFPENAQGVQPKISFHHRTIFCED